MSVPTTDSFLIDRYLELGLRLGRHVDGFVDAYYGPRTLSERVDAEPIRSPESLVMLAAELLRDLDGGADAEILSPSRRRWLRAQIIGFHTSAR